MENEVPKRPRLSEPLPNRRKNEVCFNFQRGSCDYGHRCCFAHCIQHLKKQPIAVEADKTKLCWRFMNGEICQFGDKCHFIHLKSEQRKQFPWKTKLCNRWMFTGTCKYGLTCCFAHGHSELQNQGLNDAQDYAEGGQGKLVDEKEGKGLKVKWNNYDKISRVYADWINDVPLSSGTI